MTSWFRYISCAAVFLLVGCVGGGLDAPTALQIAVPRDSTFDPARATFANSMIVGTVTGGSMALNFDGLSANDLRDGLQESLEINGLLAASPEQAKYRIDADVSFATTFGFEVDTTTHYRIFAIGVATPVFEQVIQTSNVQKSPLEDPRGVAAFTHVMTLGEFGAQSDMRWQDAYRASTRDNFRALFAALSQAKPKATSTNSTALNRGG